MVQYKNLCKLHWEHDWYIRHINQSSHGTSLEKMYSLLWRDFHRPKYGLKRLQNCWIWQSTSTLGYQVQSLEKAETIFTSCPPKLVTIDIAGRMTRTKVGNLFVFVIPNLCSNLTRAISTTKIISTQADHIIFNAWVIPHVTPEDILADNGQLFVKKFFTPLSAYWGAKNSITNAFHSQTNGQVKRFDKTLVCWLWLNIPTGKYNGIYICSSTEICIYLSGTLRS